MYKNLGAVGLVVAIVALSLGLALPKLLAQPSVLSDRELARILGGGCSVGCSPDDTLTICDGTTWTCPEAPGQEVYGSANFSGCNTNGTAYSGHDINTVESGSGTGNTKIPLYTDTDCTNDASCYAGRVRLDQRWKDGACKSFYPAWKCRSCDTMWTVGWNTEKSWRCEDP
jgi:hypothetical protein